VRLFWWHRALAVWNAPFICAFRFGMPFLVYQLTFCIVCPVSCIVSVEKHNTVCTD
jgi:hypothetical protein